MANNKVWKIVSRKEEYTDLELKKLISKGEISLEEEVYSNEILEPIKLKDTIYGFYAKGEKNETI